MSDLNKPFDKLSFLVVDDDPLGLEMIITLLNLHGAKTYEASNGATGLEFARQLYPDVIISDLSMPVMNGWKMIDELKKERTTMDIPIIALTAHAMRGDREKAIAAGCHNYMTKPIDPYSFIADLKTILADIIDTQPEDQDESTKVIESRSVKENAVSTPVVENDTNQITTSKNNVGETK